MADGRFCPHRRGGWGGYGGAPPPTGGGYAGGWGYEYGYGDYDGGYHAPLGIGNGNYAERGNNEIRVGNNRAPGAGIGNNNRAGGSNIVTVGDNTPGDYGPGGYSYGVHYFRAGLPY